MTTPLCKIARESGGDVPLDCLFGCPHRCAEEGLPGLKVIIAGSRDITNYEWVEYAMAMAAYHGLGPIGQIVSGAARGVDRLGERWAHQHGIPVRQFAVSPQEWQASRSAGHQRNMRMAMYAHACVAIWDGRSPGTRGMIRLAQGKPMPTLVVNTSDRTCEFFQ